MIKKILIFSTCIGFSLLHAIDQNQIWKKEIRWNWSKLNLCDDTVWNILLKQLPVGLQFGTATSACQIEGDRTHNNYRAHTTYEGFVENNWTDGPIKTNNKWKHVGPDHWQHWETDVDLIKQTNATAYRLSIPWEKIQPDSSDTFDEEAMDHYVALCKKIKSEGIEPWVCLFHFTFPVWFAQKGGFEKEENIQYFVKFCTYVFEKLHDTVTYWASYNEPIAYAMQGYFLGGFPPYRKYRLDLAGLVMKHMLEAHVRMAQSFKHIDPKAQIGLIHLFHPLDPYSAWNPLERLTVNSGNYLMHDSVLNFFKTGKFNWTCGLVTHTNKNAPDSLDWIGVNYYRHEILQCGPLTYTLHKYRPYEQRVPDNGRGIYPEGLYRSIVKASMLEKPIFITELGIADKTDTMRDEFYKKHLMVILKAILDGYDIRGVFIWTLMDDRGRGAKYTSKYGLYAVDEQTKERRLRKSAEPLIHFWKLYNEKHSPILENP